MASTKGAMTTSSPPPAPQGPMPAPARFRKPLGFLAGLAAGLALWLIIALVTGSILLGVLFGLAPGLAIGLGLQLTAKR
ncbi:hypothetical protein [Maricaulis sp.]|uniref:hypothetical protein n=1 Tax=Maricaulis sp. TaxID=1486257 RepID=UPI0025BF4C26|nr:hypothetical protein [Maricaulis sp.]